MRIEARGTYRDLAGVAIPGSFLVWDGRVESASGAIAEDLGFLEAQGEGIPLTPQGLSLQVKLDDPLVIKAFVQARFSQLDDYQESGWTKRLERRYERLTLPGGRDAVYGPP